MSDSIDSLIPSLQGSETTLIPAQLISRSYTWGSKRFMRRYVGDVLHHTIGLQRPVPKARFAMATNLNQVDPDQWVEIPLTQIGPREFLFELPLERRGLFAFRLRYSPDDGRTWMWDRVPESWIMVDPAAVRGLKMYTLLPPASGSCADWIIQLPHIKAMGFNMVHLLPLTLMDTSLSPYAAADLFALDHRYADPDDPRDPLAQFEVFVEAAAEHGIGLCIDLVFNHVGLNSNLARQRPEWIMPDEREHDGFRRAGWEGADGWHKWLDLALIDYAHAMPETRRHLWEYMRGYCRFWADFAARTGGMIRLDNLHSSHESFARWVLDDLRTAHPNLIVFAELFADHSINERLIRDFGLNLLLGTQWEHHFVPELRRYLTFVHSIPQRVRYFLPISTHDSGTPTQEFGDVRSTLPRYAISCFYSQGHTGMTQGVEFGSKARTHFIGSNVSITLTDGIDYTDIIRRFHGLMDSSPVFLQNGNLRFIDDQHHAIIGAWRGESPEAPDGYILLTNFDIHHEQSISLDFRKYGLAMDRRYLHEQLTDEQVLVHGDRLDVLLPPCGVKVYKIMV